MRDKMKKNNLTDAIKEIKKLANEFKAQNGNSSLKIPNKDFNLWIVNKLIQQDGRVNRLEATTKILSALLCGILIKITIF
jgi:hypothetical protein